MTRRGALRGGGWPQEKSTDARASAQRRCSARCFSSAALGLRDGARRPGRRAPAHAAWPRPGGRGWRRRRRDSVISGSTASGSARRRRLTTSSSRPSFGPRRTTASARKRASRCTWPSARARGQLGVEQRDGARRGWPSTVISCARSSGTSASNCVVADARVVVAGGFGLQQHALRVGHVGAVERAFQADAAGAGTPPCCAACTLTSETSAFGGRVLAGALVPGMRALVVAGHAPRAGDHQRRRGRARHARLAGAMRSASACVRDGGVDVAGVEVGRSRARRRIQRVQFGVAGGGRRGRRRGWNFVARAGRERLAMLDQAVDERDPGRTAPGCAAAGSATAVRRARSAPRRTGHGARAPRPDATSGTRARRLLQPGRSVRRVDRSGGTCAWSK